VPSLRDSFHFPTYPRTYVRGYHIPSLSGLEMWGLRATSSAKIQFSRTH